MDESSLQHEFFRPLATGWMGKLEAAERYRAKWKEIADECKMFFSRSASAMWDAAYQRKFWKGMPTPRFRMTLNKAFEFVALVGPNLMWDVPHRNVEPKKPLEIPQEIFGDVQNDPMAQMFQQQAMQEHQQTMVQDKALAGLLGAWLNYTPREMPDGGLIEQSYMATLDAMLTGRGCLWVRPYRMPEGRTTLTGAFREPPDRLLIDPDFNSLGEAKWISLKHIATTSDVEKRFKLPPGSMKKAASLESMTSLAALPDDPNRNSERAAGQTNDRMVYYEIWSKTGCGCRLTGMDVSVKTHLEETVGDYAYIVIAPNVPYPLNCPTELLRAGASTDQVRERFKWPIETWRDMSWPVRCLDFYPDTDHSWPIAPLAPGLGQLKFLNTMFSHVCNRIWSSSRDFIAIAQAAFADLEKFFKEGEDQVLIPIKDAVGPIRNSVDFLQQPQTNLDVWRIIEAVSESFDKAVGLTPVLYAMNPGDTQARSAEETKAKAAAAGTRPEYMSKRVIEWQSNVAALEAFCARLFITGQDVYPLLGSTGAMLWDKLVRSSDIEKVLRQFNYTVSASSIRRPNRDRDVANLNEALSRFLPVYQAAYQATGDPTAINAIMRKWGETVDMDMSDVLIGPPPPPSPEVQQQQQQQMELEQAKVQADIQKAQASVQAQHMKMQVDQNKAALDFQTKQQDAQMKQQSAMFDLQAQREKMALEREGKQQDLKFTMLSKMLDLRTDQQRATQDLRQDALASRQKLDEQRRMGETKVQLAKAQAAAKPKPQPKPSTNGAKR